MIGVETRYYIDVRVDNLSLDDALERVETLVSEGKDDGVTRQVFFTNVHSIHLARRDKELQRYLSQADLVLPDGSGLAIAGEVLNMPIQANLNGTDFTPKVCRMAEVGGWSVYLLGARENVVKNCYENMQKRFPHLELAGYHNGYFSEEEELQIIQEINEQEPDILLVALGSPLQEKWVARNAHRINANVCFAVGGLFDFMGNNVERAPRWMRKLGIEWLYRFLQQPAKKWDRIFIEIPEFLFLVFGQKVKSLIPRTYLKQLNLS